MISFSYVEFHFFTSGPVPNSISSSALKILFPDLGPFGIGLYYFLNPLNGVSFIF
jgi:hypothetical protein